LVGVMVAVAILPPAATFGMMLGMAEFEKANGAALLLAVNIVCINLSAKLVFLLRGIQPRTWSEKQRARTSVGIAITMWVASLVILVAIIYFKWQVSQLTSRFGYYQLQVFAQPNRIIDGGMDIAAGDGIAHAE